MTQPANTNPLYGLLDSASKATVDRRTEADRRMQICKECPVRQQKQLVSVCTECGCILEHKVERAGDTCPLNKW